MKILLIIPCYNEEESILPLINKINEYNTKAKIKYDYVVINDGSSDKTEEILTENNINHIKLLTNLGIGGAVQTGYKYANEKKYDIAIQFDGDGQHNIDYVEKLVKPIINNEANMVIGSRFINKDVSNFKSTKMRRVGIKILSFFIKFVTHKKIYDTTSGMRAIDKKIIEIFANEYPTEYPEPISTTEVLKYGLTVKEVSVVMNERDGGVSSIRSWKNFYYMMNVILSILLVGLRRKK